MDPEDKMHANSGYGYGITVRAHMALEITKALIINPKLAEQVNQDLVKSVSLTGMAVQITDSLLKKLED